MSGLLVGIKRQMPRLKDERAKDADRVFNAVRPSVKEKQNNKCYHCGFISKDNEVHHLDDNHHNNDDKNMVVICRLCHPYHHVGEAARQSGLQAERDGHIPSKAVALMRVSSSYSDAVSPENMNRLMRVIGMALSDKDEAASAKEIYALLVDAQQVKAFANDIYGEGSGINRLHPSDLAAGLAQLTHDEYEQRGAHLNDVRLVYHTAYLSQLGSHIKAEAGGLKAPSQWRQVLGEQFERVKNLVITHSAKELEPADSNENDQGSEDSDES